MKSNLKPIKFLLLFILLIGMNACSKEEDNVDDPIIGNWKLESIRIDSDEMNVANEPCYKDSYCNITSSEIKLHLSIPDNSSCNEQTSSGKWEKKNGKYWELDGNDGSTLLPISIERDNLVFSVLSNGKTIKFIFNK